MPDEPVAADLLATDLALARAVIYRTLAIGLRRPAAGGPARLRSEAARDALRAASQLLDRTCRPSKLLVPAAMDLLESERASAADFDDLYVRLFGHTARGLVCPCGTEYGLEGAFQQPQQLADIAGYYRAFGLRVQAGSDQRVDHVACECEFMDFLCCKEAFLREQWAGGLETDPQPGQTLEQTCKAEASFLRDHLGRFGRAFGHQLVTEDENGFYGNLGHLLFDFLDLECGLVGVEAGPAMLRVRTDGEEDIPMACGTSDSLIQIGRRDDYVRP